MASSHSKALLPSDLRADDTAPLPTAPLPTGPVLTFRALLIFITVLFGVAVTNNWRDPKRIAYFVVCYVLFAISTISHRRTCNLPYGSPAAAWARRASFLSWTCLFAAGLFKIYFLI